MNQNKPNHQSPKLYEIIEQPHWEIVFVGTESECDAFIENPDHNEKYIIREVRRNQPCK